MKNNITLVILSISLMFLIACQQAVKKETAPADAMKKTEAPATAPKVETTGNAAVDAVSKDLNNVDTVYKDLSADQLGDLDSGLADVQKI